MFRLPIVLRMLVTVPPLPLFPDLHKPLRTRRYVPVVPIFRRRVYRETPPALPPGGGFFVGLISSKKHPSGGYPYLPPLILNRLTGRCCLRSKQRTLSKSERSLNERFRYWWCKRSAQDNGYGSPSQSSCSEGKSRRHARCYTRCDKHSE